MAKTNSTDKELDPYKDIRSEKMTALSFGKIRGFSLVDQMAVKKLYGKDEKPFQYWEKIFKDDIVFN